MNSFMNTIRLLARTSLVEAGQDAELPDMPMTTFRDSSNSPRPSLTGSDVDLERGGVWCHEFPSPSASPVSSKSLGVLACAEQNLLGKSDKFGTELKPKLSIQLIKPQNYPRMIITVLRYPHYSLLIS
ncbi:hypothetical protein FRC08_004457 [Ceratobasidium sp. 394]|nr:hypothetical protein FRC08_004457 [Ceratobasidium sp. 394]